MEVAIEKEQEQSNYMIPMAIIGLLFFIFGFVTWLNGSLIPFLEIVCELTTFQAFFVTFAFYIAYTVTALPMSMVLRKVGYNKGMMIGLCAMAAGALLFIPAAHSRIYAIFLLALFLIATGLTLLQTAANPYIVKMGPQKSAAMRICIMGLLNKGAGIVAPIVFSLLMFHKFDAKAFDLLDQAAQQTVIVEMSDRLIMPSIVMAVVLIIFGLAMFKIKPLPELDEEEADDGSEDKWAILQYPHVILGTIALFFYVGVEVMAGDTIGLYAKAQGVENFGQMTAYTMAFMVLGYLIGVATIPKLISQQSALLASAVLGLLCTLGVMFAATDSSVIADNSIALLGIATIPDSVFFLALLGLANAMVWPTVWPLALDGLGKHTATGSALLIMGIAGGAIFPLLYGLFADSGDVTDVAEKIASAQQAYWVMLLPYLYIFYYALFGHKKRSW